MAVLCPHISNANISVQGSGFSLYKVSWSQLPLATQLVSVQYKKSIDATWLLATTNLQVDVNGNLVSSSFVILETAELGVQYDVRLVNQCGSIEYIQSFTYQSQIFANNCLIDNALYNICGNDPVTLFSGEPFASGVTMYEDVGLTTPLTGFLFIDYNGNSIFNINSGTGVVGSTTAYSCVLYSFQVLLGNNAGTVCAATPITVYSNTTTPTIGDILYTDAALSEVVEGFDFVVLGDSLIKYNIDAVTGEILSLQGSSCNGYAAYYQVSKITSDIGTQTAIVLYSSTPFGKGAEMKTDDALSSAVTGFNYIKQVNGNVIRDISTTTGVVGCTSNEC
jgi:hypothetical protein